MKLNITNFMIGLLVVGFFIFVIFSFIQPLASTGNIDNYDENSSIRRINFSNNIEPLAKAQEKQLNGTSSDPTFFDIVGNFINTGWATVKNLYASKATFEEFSDAAISDTAEGNSGFSITGLVELKTLINISIGILLLIGFGLYFLTGREP